jgi:hypothetical protein
MREYNPIPTTVLDKIKAHRPNYATMCSNYAALVAAGKTMQACQIGNAIANGYLNGETRLSAKETWLLGHHCPGTATGDNYYGYGKA